MRDPNTELAERLQEDIRQHRRSIIEMITAPNENFSEIKAYSEEERAFLLEAINYSTDYRGGIRYVVSLEHSSDEERNKDSCYLRVVKVQGLNPAILPRMPSNEDNYYVIGHSMNGVGALISHITLLSWTRQDLLAVLHSRLIQLIKQQLKAIEGNLDQSFLELESANSKLEGLSK